MIQLKAAAAASAAVADGGGLVVPLDYEDEMFVYRAYARYWKMLEGFDWIDEMMDELNCHLLIQ